MKTSGRYRWWIIAALLAAITAINYVDRQTLAVLVAGIAWLHAAGPGRQDARAGRARSLDLLRTMRLSRNPGVHSRAAK